jgi:outer membrane usher protein
VSYTHGLLKEKGLLALTYTRTLEPQSTSSWVLSLRYFFDTITSVAATVGGTGNRNTQGVSLERSIPQGEGVGYALGGGHAGGQGSDGAFGRAFVQVNAANATFGGEYSRASNPEAGVSMSNVFVAGSIGYVGGRVFAARPIEDSFALVRLPELADVPVYANSWYAGKTNADGEVVVNNIGSYYDNFIVFGAKDLPLDYVFPSAEKIISPMTRSGSLVQFAIRKNHAVIGVLVIARDGKQLPLEFREIVLERSGAAIQSFTAHRGEFYADGVEPGEYRVRVKGDPPCAASIKVPDPADAMTDVGIVICDTTQ